MSKINNNLKGSEISYTARFGDWKIRKASIVKPVTTVYEGITKKVASFLVKLKEEGLQSH